MENIDGYRRYRFNMGKMASYFQREFVDEGIRESETED